MQNETTPSISRNWNEDGQFWKINSEQTLEFFLQRVREMYKEHRYLEMQWKVGKQRSHSQNNALHLYCHFLAVALNEAGYDMMHFFDEGAEVPWKKMTVKENIWVPIQMALTQKYSTTEAHKLEYVEVYDVLNRHLSTKFGVSVPWPSK